MLLALLLLLIVLAVIAGVMWKLQQKPPLGPKEATLEALALMKRELMVGSDHDFGIRLSTLLRNYLNAFFGLAAPRQTTEEFLRSLQGEKRFSVAEQEALSNFLHQADLLKFAQGVFQAEERLALIEAAERFVQQEAALPATEESAKGRERA